MRLDQSQHLALRQEMRLAPRIIQAMEILQLPMLALQERIDAELVSNPVLELQEFSESEGSEESPRSADRDRGESQMIVDEAHGHREDFQRLDEMATEYGPEFAGGEGPTFSRRAGSGEGDAKMEAMANAPAPAESLMEHLEEQWAFIEAPLPVKQAGDLIIAHVGDDGYLRTSLEELTQRAAENGQNIEPANLREALRLVQTLEPTGVGARDLRECLLIQLAVREAAGQDVAMEKLIVSSFLREIELNRLPDIAKRTGRSLEEVKAAIERIARLDPRPGLVVGGTSAPVIRPDVIVTLDDNNEVVVRLADEQVPSLAINDYYRRQAGDRQTDRNTKQFLRRNIRSAEWLIEAIAQRRHTIRRVTEEVFKVQKEFLESGPEALKSLPMADVAGKVGVHVATVSRAVSDKYVQTPRGVFPLRMFFSGGTKTAGGEDMSWDAVRAKLQEIVDRENKSHPLNDDELAEALKAEGIDIARRTVAKYRGLMDIPPARKRKEY